ncbi:MAG TPA: SpoIIE family protein phosphatase [Burkholderiales bacterium]|nr:SpoIIE family protein phosphatase [Burkholderiales bacterium]
MYQERGFTNRNSNPGRRKPVGDCVFPLALAGGTCISAERRQSADRRREGYESPLQLFREIPPRIVQELLESCPVREFAAETVVLSPGQTNEHIYMLLGGQLRVHLDAVDSANQILIDVGGCIGELSIIDGKPVSAYVVAEQGCRLLIIPQEAFWARILPNPGIARNLLRVLTERMRRNNETILQGMRQQLVYEHIQKELRLAREIQASMLPERQPGGSGAGALDICAAMEPAREVGGDLYDFFYVGEGELCFLVGDVSDKGLAAALFMARTMDIVRVVTRLLRSKDGSAPQPEEIIACVNRELCQNNASFMFVTLFFGMLDLRSGRLRYCNAGHNSPYVVGTGGTATALSGVRSTPLGIKDDSDFRTASITLARDELLFVFSDGITEAMNAAGDFYTEERLERLLLACAGRPSAQVIDAVIDSVGQFVGEVAPSDDITAMAIRLPPAP